MAFLSLSDLLDDTYSSTPTETTAFKPKRIETCCGAANWYQLDVVELFLRLSVSIAVGTSVGISHEGQPPESLQSFQLPKSRGFSAMGDYPEGTQGPFASGSLNPNELRLVWGHLSSTPQKHGDATPGDKM